MITVNIEARIDCESLVRQLRQVPSLGSGTPTVVFRCGAFTCDTIEEVWGVVKAIINVDTQEAYAKLKDFAP